MVNTTNRKKHVAKTVEITVNDNFTMTSDMGGFTIEVNNGTTVVAAPSAGAAPQMILVSNPNWSWPYERTNIVDAYEGFQEWAADASKNQDWYNTPTGNTIDGDFTNSTPEKDEETETTTPDDEKKEEGGEDGSTGTTPDNEEKEEDDNKEVSGDSTNDAIAVDMDAVKANGNVIPASYFTSSNKVDIIITVSNTAYIQFGEYGNYVGNYFSDSYTFTITDQTNLLKIQEKGLSFAQGIESIASITIINY